MHLFTHAKLSKSYVSAHLSTQHYCEQKSHIYIYISYWNQKRWSLLVWPCISVTQVSFIESSLLFSSSDNELFVSYAGEILLMHWPVYSVRKDAVLNWAVLSTKCVPFPTPINMSASLPHFLNYAYVCGFLIHVILPQIKFSLIVGTCQGFILPVGWMLSMSNEKWFADF